MDRFEDAPSSPDEVAAPVEVPLDALSPEILNRIIEEFVLREGTDYGASEVSLDTKTQQILGQLRKGTVKIYFDPDTESVTLVRT